jgi:aspartyl-tRNA(Asn)/glutamyl-tRNA(Gln) amidotransferase subunit C
MKTLKNRKIDAKNTKLSEEEVKHVAALAKLSLTSQETAKFQKQLSAILDYVALLNEVKTDKVEPTSQVTGLENVFRKDERGTTLTQEEALSGVKEKHQGRFKIKAIFEQWS